MSTRVSAPPPQPRLTPKRSLGQRGLPSCGVSPRSCSPETLVDYSFGTCQQRKLFPHFSPPSLLGNKFLPLRGAPHLGPGCYLTEDVSMHVPLRSQFPDERYPSVLEGKPYGICDLQGPNMRKGPGPLQPLSGPMAAIKGSLLPSESPSSASLGLMVPSRAPTPFLPPKAHQSMSPLRPHLDGG